LEKDIAMKQPYIQVTREAVRTLTRLSADVQALNSRMRLELDNLSREFEDKSPYLGPHCHEIRQLLEELEELCAEAQTYNRKLARKTAQAAAIRQNLLDNQPYKNGKDFPEDFYLPDAFGQVYEELTQRKIYPKELGPRKEE
jgi:chromosome segregation ATPase